MSYTAFLHTRRKNRVRRSLKKNNKQQRLRLCVHRSNQHISVQLIDDKEGKTLASASSNETEVKSKHKVGSNIAAAEAVGALIGKRAKAAKVDTVVFDRGGFLYHGRVKALADAAREAGLKF